MNKEEFESCYNRHFDFVYRLSFTYVKNPADAEDVAQETFVRLYRQEGEFASEEHVRRWLLRVAINLSKDHLRSRWNQKGRSSMRICRRKYLAGRRIKRKSGRK